MKSRILVIAAAAVASLAATGCLSGSTAGTRVEDGVVVAENPAFAARFAAERDTRVVTDQGFLRVQVKLRNLGSSDRALQYRFQWRGKDGLVLHSAAAPWRPLVMHGREIHELESVCPVQGAEDFRLEIRPL